MKEITTHARVEHVTPLTDSILKITLVPKRYINYNAGQYLQIVLGEEVLSYSIANAPIGSKKYELHIRHSKENPHHQSLLNEIKHQDDMTLKLPFGACELTQLDLNKPILFIAAGTGFAPIKAMIEQLLADGDKRVFELFWGARSQSDLYMDDMVLQWQAHVPHFRYFSKWSKMNEDTLTSMILARHANDLPLWQVVMSGPFDMMYSMRDELLRHGMSREYIFSDAFAFEDAQK